LEEFNHFTWLRSGCCNIAQAENLINCSSPKVRECGFQSHVIAVNVREYGYAHSLISSNSFLSIRHATCFLDVFCAGRMMRTHNGSFEFQEEQNVRYNRLSYTE
jgi:hypothetical protein